MPDHFVYVLIIVFIATLVRSTFGFGESLVAVPLLVQFIPVETAVPLSVMLSVLVALIIVTQDHRKIHFNSAKWLILFALPGIPLGLVLLIYGNDALVKTGLGLLIVFYSVYSLFEKRSLELKKDNMFKQQFVLPVCLHRADPYRLVPALRGDGVAPKGSIIK